MTKEARAVYHKQWAKDNPDKIALYKARHWPKKLQRQKEQIPILRMQIFEKLGGCRCSYPGCTWTDPRALQIDHIEGGGHKERRAYGVGPYWLKKVLNDPEIASKYQVLCCNHNWIKRSESNEVPNKQRTSPHWVISQALNPPRSE